MIIIRSSIIIIIIIISSSSSISLAVSCTMLSYMQVLRLLGGIGT